MNVLAIGAHPDDIELGCGASLLAHRERGDRISLLVMSNGQRGMRDSQPRTVEQERAAAALGAALYWGGFEDAAIPEGRPAVAAIEEIMHAVAADIVYSHAPNDTHQDHRATSLATLAATRRLPRVCMYESPTTLRFSPSVFVDVEGLVEPKVELISHHASQVLKNGIVDLAAIRAQATYRGFQARVRAAEAFETDRFVWDMRERRLDDEFLRAELELSRP